MTSHTIRTVSVFAGSSMGNSPAYAAAMYALGLALADAGKDVWAGGHVGMTEMLACGLSDRGGILNIYQPDHYATGRTYPAHVRVNQIATDNDRTIALLKSDAWITGPGSAGTIGETVRGITWNLDRTYRNRPITPHFILNANGCHKSLVAMYRNAVNAGFGSEDTMKLFHVADHPDDLMRQMAAVEAGPVVTLSRVSSVTPAP